MYFSLYLFPLFLSLDTTMKSLAPFFFTPFHQVFIHVDTHSHTFGSTLKPLFSRLKNPKSSPGMSDAPIPESFQWTYAGLTPVCPCQTKMVSSPERALSPCNARHLYCSVTFCFDLFPFLLAQWPGDVLGRICKWSSTRTGTTLWHDLRCTYREVDKEVGPS